MPSILFVCTANRFRSPIAAALFEQRLQKDGLAQDWYVESAGTWAESGAKVIPSAKWVTDHTNLDLRSHRARRINHVVLTRQDLILVMENSHREALRAEFPEIKDRVYLLAKAASGLAYDVPDPSAVPGNTFLDIAQELSQLIEKGFEEICLLTASHMSENKI